VNYSTGLATQYSHDLLVRSLLTGAGLLLLALVVFAIVTRMSNRLIRRLRRLQSETMDLVSQRLPTIVEQLGKGAQVDVESALPPLDHGTDEIGQVADAFNQAQRTAVAAAAKEAETRAGTSKVFLNIAHRSQVVAHRQLKLLDQAERTQEDPDQLSLLFQLDHLTTRSRRNAENLIILGGGKPGRQWRNPVPLLDVVRSAVGEAETYTGITIEQMPKASVAGAAVADIIHLLAELVDNATRFSPPTARVEVRGNVAGRGIVIEIEDQGLGIEREQLEELNETLQKPPDFSVMALSDEPRLGLFVVRQLSVRHGVRVTLTESPAYGGIRAIVLLPLALITATVPALPEMPSRSGPPRADLRETISGNVEVIGSVLPTRKTSRMISLAPNAPLPAQPPPTEAPAPESGATEPRVTEPPAAQPRATEPPAAAPPATEVPAPEPPARPAPTPWPSRVAREGDWQTAEIPVIKAELLSNGNLKSSTSATDPAKVTAAERDQRPALPKRTRQAHLAPQLLRDNRVGVEPPPAPAESSISAESARARLTAFQFGTRRGREDNPTFDS
jgi:signal transduction histidine kinase